MRHGLPFVATLLVVLATAPALGQPDFSGEWRLDCQASGLKAPPSPDYVEIWTQTATSLTVDNGHGPQAVITYHLDGRPTNRKSDSDHYGLLTKADWGASESSLLVRFVARKPDR